MRTTSISQLELGGVMTEGENRPDHPAQTSEAIAGRTSHVDVVPPRREITDTPDCAPRKSAASRQAREAGTVETLLNFAEAAQVLGISLRQFRRLVDAGKLTFVKVSERTPRVRPSELQRFLEASAVKYTEVQS